MPSRQLTLPAAAHRNQQLFSDHYLNTILPTRPEWRQLLPAAQTVVQRVVAIYAAFTPSDNEAQTERDLIQPILTELGHTFEVQPTLATPDGAKRPDYVFFQDAAAVAAHKKQVLNDESLRGVAFAVGDAKYWDRPLDIALKKPGGDPFSNKNPSYQIAFYIQHSGLPWGILTNGRLWRLYHRDTAHKLDRYYEIDLTALLETGEPAQFLYFLAFFGRAAFESHNPLGVAAMLRESIDYARGVGNSLKDQVFDALRQIGQGFLDNPTNDLALDHATLKATYDNTLILLYRLLFIFYAEARGLLPLRSNATYRDLYSLHALTHQIADDLDNNRHLLPSGDRIWRRLRELFKIIDDGSPPLNVATFDGGLFDPARHPFLEQYAVGDARLQLALDALARVKGQFVDYRDLAEQHLGTIYEALLEHHFTEIANEDGWRIDVVNERGERKRTGVYYTPDFIVKYIVAQTLDPILEATVAEHAENAQVDAILNINVLDPAMGSGYFLVEATEYIARFLVDRALLPADADDREAEGSDLAYWKRRVVQSCIYGVDINPLAVDLAKLSLWLSTAAKDRPLSFLDHHLRTGNALVGARISELETGTGKARKPVKSAARKREEQAAEAGQLSMLADDAFRRSMSNAVGSMWLIEESAGNTVDEVKEQERLYADLHAQLTRRYGQLADLVTARKFGLAIDDDLWPTLVSFVLGRSVLITPPQFAGWLAQTADLAARERFFHWDLEFPEIFFDRHGRPLGDAAGFDAVIGNPPYVRQEVVAKTKPYFAAQYPEVFQGTADLFVYFFAQGMRLSNHGGRLGYISSSSWLRANYASQLRSFLRKNVSLKLLIDLGDNRVFSSAPDVYPAIVVVRNVLPMPDHVTLSATFTRGEGVEHFEVRVAEKLSTVSLAGQPDSGWHLAGPSQQRLLAHLQNGGHPLGDVVGGRIYYGLKTGLVDAFIVGGATRAQILTSDIKSDSLLMPYLRGEDLRPWYHKNNSLWIITIPNGWTAQMVGSGLDEQQAWKRLSDIHPGIAHHLAPFADRARSRSDQGEYWWELRPCDYYGEFDRPKVLWPDIAKFPRFSWDSAGYYLGDTAFFISTDQLWILAYLASRCSWFLISQNASSLGERAGMNRYRLKDQYMRPLPVPSITDAEQNALASFADCLTASARARYDLHRKARHRILTDFGTPGQRLNQKLTAWWTLDFPAFRAEVKKALKQEIALKERDDWEAWLTEHRTEHERLTAEIIRLETDLNAHVYALFDLSAADIRLIEESTKYRYGEV